jgi:pyruvate/2-oxoglutarate dehydrogenase complex dihydrolipoamide acyltransferase (E2) component
MLMDLAAPEAKFPPARDTSSLQDCLEDDVATLTYENALRIHGRYRPSAPAQKPLLVQPPPAPAQAPAQPASASSPARESPDRRSASVTVRLCHAESERLRQRAAESGLTLSEYMRSCVFEVEILRAQVKETVADLRAAQTPSAPHLHWWQRWFPVRAIARKPA